jgi:DNA-binding winged helix-turn-helix (wHTH) protein/tetratricopeptide (TPR) repeat protein
MPSSGGYVFGSFRLDIRSQRLTRNGVLLPLPPAQAAVLLTLVARAGEIVTKDQLLSAAWPDTVVSENTLARAVMQLRRTLEDAGEPGAIDTAVGHGYRFAANATWIDDGAPGTDIDAVLAPHLRWVDGRALFDRLEGPRFDQADTLFASLLETSNNVRFHIGRANACAMRFLNSRADAEPDFESLRVAGIHTNEACRIDPRRSDAWAAAGLVATCRNESRIALAALERAVRLSPHNWQHWILFSFADWGQNRIVSAETALAELHEIVMAWWLIATVFIARRRFDLAEDAIDQGLACIPKDGRPPARMLTVALNWLKGLLRLRQGDNAGARAFLARELALEASRQLFSREVCAAAYATIAAIDLKEGNLDAADEAVTGALSRAPRLPMAHAIRAIIRLRQGLSMPPAPVDPGSMTVDDACAYGAVLGEMGDRRMAVRAVAAALASAPPGSAGWRIPLEPMLRIDEHPDEWADVLRAVSLRAD